jgi:hypothetical protein
MTKGLMLALAGGIALAAFAWLGRRSALGQRPKPKEELERWEGEGGNLAPPRRANGSGATVAQP